MYIFHMTVNVTVNVRYTFTGNHSCIKFSLYLNSRIWYENEKWDTVYNYKVIGNKANADLPEFRSFGRGYSESST